MPKGAPTLSVPSFPSAEVTGTSAEKRVCTGEGLTVATAGDVATFTIEARDAQGNRMTAGGDNFFVYIRGPSKVRANVMDNQNGMHTVEWRVRCATRPLQLSQAPHSR